MYHFQLISACLEDIIPPSFPEGASKEEVLDDVEGVEGVRTKKKIEDACVAFLFGRLEDGRSICVRVEGCRPKLFFDAEGVRATDLKMELVAEVARELKGETILVQTKRFANFNGYEPDESSPSGRKVHTYYQVEYPSLRSWRKAVSLRKEDDERIREARTLGMPSPERRYRLAHECNVDPMTRFLREMRLITGGWNSVERSSTPSSFVTVCDVEIEASHFEPLPDKVQMSPYVVAYFDLETLGLDPTTASIIQWSLVFVKEDLVEKHCVAVGEVSPLEGCTIHSVGSEEALLRKGRRILMEKDPDFVVAYNGVNFDNKMLAVRAESGRERVESFFYLSRFAFRQCRLRELSLASSGMGDNKFSYIDMPGRATVDFFVKFKVDEPSEISWSLSHFTRKYIPGEDKEEMDYREIPGLQSGSADDRRRLASYCVHDSYLLHLLNKARNVLVIVLQFAQVFGILPEWVYLRGQQVRFMSQLLEGARTLEAVPLLIQTPKDGFVGMFDSSGFEGATVNEPLCGYYKSDPTATLDWKSLYPSVMLAHNLCHSTHVVTEDLQAMEGVVPHRVRSLGTQWREVTLKESPPSSSVCGSERLQIILRMRRREALLAEKGEVKGRTFLLTKKEWEEAKEDVTSSSLVPLDEENGIFAQPFGEHTTHFTTKHRGILPRILESLLAERVRCKKMMKKHAKEAKEEKDPSAAQRCAALADVFDGRQLAVKVSANSVYGAAGAGVTGKCPNKDVSETVTFVGRETMVTLKRILYEKYPNVDVIYGDTDSVMIQFKGTSDLKQCALLAQEAADFITDEFARLGFPDMVLEFEKIYYPYLLLKKKRYIGLMYVPDGEEMFCKGIDAKGVETERKDTLPFLKKIYVDVRNLLMFDKDEKGALAKLEEHLWRLIRNEVPFEDLVMSKGLRSSYKDATTQVQCMVNEKRKQREAGSEAAVGDRVWYVIVDGPLNEKTTSLAEDADYAKRNSLPLNRLWYFEHAIRKPMSSLFAQVKGVDASSLFEVVEAELKREKNGGTNLREFVSPSSSTSDPFLVPTKVHVPAPPPPPIKRKKK